MVLSSIHVDVTSSLVSVLQSSTKIFKQNLEDISIEIAMIVSRVWDEFCTEDHIRIYRPCIFVLRGPTSFPCLAIIWVLVCTALTPLCALRVAGASSQLRLTIGLLFIVVGLTIDLLLVFLTRDMRNAVDGPDVDALGKNLGLQLAVIIVDDEGAKHNHHGASPMLKYDIPRLIPCPMAIVTYVTI